MSENTATASQSAPTADYTPGAWLSWNFAGTVLVSAFLLFQVQPLISKFILPWFGGSPAVWTTCMLFFQVLLFAGYAYAHLCQRLLSPRAQGVCHAALLVTAALLLNVEPSVSWKPPDSDQPTLRILQLLLVCVGLPYFSLSATGPLLQAWFSRAYPGRSPYRLYALSNVGSLLALLSYPFVFEPAFDVLRQISLWSAGYYLFVVLCGVCAIWIARRNWAASVIGAMPEPAANASAAASASDAAPSLWRRLLWVGLPACASLMLLATTNHVCQDVTPIPFLWVVPLSLYLLTFIISFDHERWYVRPLFCGLAIALLLSVVEMPQIASFLKHTAGHQRNFKLELAVYFAAMFSVCMICHGELVRSRPSSHYLTEFYLLISAGGALGGIFVSLIAPEVFNTFFEWKIGLTLSFLLATIVLGLSLAKHFEIQRVVAMGAALPAGLLCPLLLYLNADPDRPEAITRNFYGVVSVWNVPGWRTSEGGVSEPDPGLDHFSMLNGAVPHGNQFSDPKKHRTPTTYYPPFSGVGQAITYLQDRKELRVGTIGLGVGTLAAYAREGDYFRFYEINPVVPELAKKYFTYLKDCEARGARYDIILGDARLSMEREEPQQFNVLVVDAFSGDAIPTHLLTEEAFNIYQKHLAADGILAIHITNHYLDLSPVVRKLAEHFEMGTTRIDVVVDSKNLIGRSHWMLVTKDQSFLDSHPPQLSKQPDKNEKPREVRLWTDHYSNLFEILY